MAGEIGNQARRPPLRRLALVVFGLLIIGAVVTISRGVPAAVAPGEQIALGERIYAANCAACHGPSAEGEYPDAPQQPGPDGLFGAPPHDETGHTWHHPDDLLWQIIRDGSSVEGFKEMPAFGTALTDEEIEAVLAYIKTLWTDEQRDIQAEMSQQ